MRQGYIANVRQWLTILPNPVVETDYMLTRTQAWLHYFSQETGEASIWIEHSQKILNHADMTEDAFVQAQSSLLGLQSWVVHHRSNAPFHLISDPKLVGSD